MYVYIQINIRLHTNEYLQHLETTITNEYFYTRRWFHNSFIICINLETILTLNSLLQPEILSRPTILYSTLLFIMFTAVTARCSLETFRQNPILFISFRTIQTNNNMTQYSTTLLLI